MVNTPRDSDNSITGTGTGNGYGGKDSITVTVMLKDGKISNVTASGPNETQGIGSNAIEKMPALMVEKNSITVDGVTGATISSTGILQAAEAALKAAGVNPEDFKAKTVAAKNDTPPAIPVEDKEFNTDIVIVGAGGAGMVAAITAADSGKKVILIEKQSMAGGNSVRATGGMNATKTPEQDRRGRSRENFKSC